VKQTLTALYKNGYYLSREKKRKNRAIASFKIGNLFDRSEAEGKNSPAVKRPGIQAFPVL